MLKTLLGLVAMGGTGVKLKQKIVVASVVGVVALVAAVPAFADCVNPSRSDNANAQIAANSPTLKPSQCFYSAVVPCSPFLTINQVSIPVSLKMGYYFSGLATTAIELSKTGIAGLVLFNRPFHPDIDINKLETQSKYMLSDPTEYSDVLRWMALLSGRVECPLVATTGIHTGETAIKQLLAGATAIEAVSAIYKHGYPVISEIINDISKWMDEKGYKTLDGFRGKMNQQGIANPAEFERVQFMRLYSEIV